MKKIMGFSQVEVNNVDALTDWCGGSWIYNREYDCYLYFLRNGERADIGSYICQLSDGSFTVMTKDAMDAQLKRQGEEMESKEESTKQYMTDKLSNGKTLRFKDVTADRNVLNMLRFPKCVKHDVLLGDDGLMKVANDILKDLKGGN